MAPTDYAERLGARLRAVRNSQGLSLHAVEEKSGGKWKAVVVGSYERATRSVTTERLAQLASFYGVATADLLPDGDGVDGDKAAVGHLTALIAGAGVKSAPQALSAALAVAGAGYVRAGKDGGS